MKLSGSLNNRLAERGPFRLPTVGDGATVYHYTDRNAATVTAIDGEGEQAIVSIVLDKATRTDTNGMSESQQHRFEPGDGAPEAVVWCGDGWRIAGRTPNRKVSRAKNRAGAYVRFGHRSEYYDYGF